MSSTNQANTRKTNVPEITFGDRGLILPEESDILEGVIEDFNNAFGKDLQFYNEKGDFLLSTPQGQLATAWAAIISDRNRLLAYYVNQVDPSYAMGRMQDGIGRIYFIERRPATYTTVTGKCSGKTGTVIPEGTKVQDQQGNLYESTEEAIIQEGSTESFVNINFQCTEKGAITCPAGTLTERYQVIPGWESITNEADGVVGQNTESQAQFEQRRRLSVAGNSVNSVDSIMAGLLNLVTDDDKKTPICQDAYVIENSLGEEVTNGTVKLKSHSVYICVVASGGWSNEQAIAKAIWRKKSPGCGMTGDHDVTIADDTKDDAGNPLYTSPPQYVISYSYANNVTISFQILMTRSPTAPKDASDRIKKAVKQAFLGEDGSARPRIGSTIFASSFYACIQNLGSWAVIRTLLIGRDSIFGNEVKMGINEYPTISIGNITVNFND